MKILSNSDYCRQVMASLPFSLRGRLLGIDFGRKRVGVAVTDDCREFVSGLTSFTRKNSFVNGIAAAEFAEKLCSVIFPEPCISANPLPVLSKFYSSGSPIGVYGAVVGLPMLESGKMTPFCHEIIQTIELISKLDTPISDLPCTFFNEYNTTSEAKEIIQQFSSKQRVKMERKDLVAASLILDGFITHPQAQKLLFKVSH